MTYPEQPGHQHAGSWSPQQGWSAAPTPPPPAGSQYPATPSYSSGPYPAPDRYAAIPASVPVAPNPMAGRTGLTAGGALSFVTAVSMAVAGTAALITLVAASAVTSALGSYGTSRSSASSATGEIVLVVVVALGLSFLLFWGGLEAALGRRIGIAVGGNIAAIVLVVIAATQSTGYLMLLTIVPVLAVLILAAGRPALPAA